MIRRHLISSLWSAVGGAAVLAGGAMALNGAQPDINEWWLLPYSTLVVIGACVVLGFPIALTVGVPTSMWLRRLGLSRARHYVTAGVIISIITYAIYLSYRLWWQQDDPMFPSLRTSMREYGLLSIARFEVVAAVCILSVGPFSAWCYWKGGRHAA